MNKSILFSNIVIIIILIFPGNFFAQNYSNIPHTFHNPILSGFHPDPSICRVGDDYYLVNSSFDWFPGVPIFHSKDLVNWKQIGYVLTRSSQLNMKEGLKPSRGIWASTIRYHNGTFYLVTTCQDCGGNIYVTAKNPAGPWSDPVYLKDAIGIDPTLFWDNDGTCWYVGEGNVEKIKKPWPNEGGIWLQKLDLDQGKLIGKRYQLTHGYASNARWAEGPHIYKINGKYLLLIAEGGTSFYHSITVFHSDSITGPYTSDHANPVLTHRNLGHGYPITTIGHGDLVQTQNGDWWAVMLGVRPVQGYNMLGRETFLTPIKFEGDTPVFNPGVGKVLQIDKRPDLPWFPVKAAPDRDNFNDQKLAVYWNFLRTPQKKWYSLTDKPGYLQLEVRPESVTKLQNPSLIARRIDHFKFKAVTKMNFEPDNKHEEAGLVVMQNNDYQYRLIITRENTQKVLRLIKVEAGQDIIEAQAVYHNKSICLGMKGDGTKYQFIYGTNDNNLQNLGKIQDATVCSTNKAGGFIGPFIGIYASSNGVSSLNHALFDWFDYSY